MADGAISLDQLSPAKQKKAARASSVEEVFALFYQQGDEAAQKAFRAGRDEREAQVRRAGYRAGGADARRATAAPARARTTSATSAATAPASSGAILSAATARRPSSSSSSSLAAPSLGGGMSAAQGRTLILLMLALDALGAVANDVIVHPNASSSPASPGGLFPAGTPLPGGGKVDPSAPAGSPTNPYNNGTLSSVQLTADIAANPGAKASALGGGSSGSSSSGGGDLVLGNYAGKVPVHLRSLAGVMVVGVLALVVNEFSPAFGVLIVLALTLDVGYQLLAPKSANGQSIPNQPAGGIYARLGSALTGAQPSSGVQLI